MVLETDRHSVQMVKLVECPRDAIQGWKTMIPTDKKVEYLNSLLGVGFDTLDFGSFVSARVIPQMADTKQVIRQLAWRGSSTRLLAIVANLRGAEEACSWEAIKLLGYPFSVSETFQQRNTHSSISGSLGTLQKIQRLCSETGKELMVYISMGFGNPYGDAYSEKIVFDWVGRISQLGVHTLSLADTVGLASPAQVLSVTGYLVQKCNDREIGVHLHSTALHWKEKIDAALEAGCRRFDGALKGIGGCPMANDELVGNINTELMIPYFNHLQLLPTLNQDALTRSIELATEIFT